MLTEAAIKGKVDPLIGLKENVILGKLIPVGTGMKRYRNTRLNTDYIRHVTVKEEAVLSEEEALEDILMEGDDALQKALDAEMEEELLETVEEDDEVYEADEEEAEEADAAEEELLTVE